MMWIPSCKTRLLDQTIAYLDCGEDIVGCNCLSLVRTGKVVGTSGQIDNEYSTRSRKCGRSVFTNVGRRRQGVLQNSPHTSQGRLEFYRSRRRLRLLFLWISSHCFGFQDDCADGENEDIADVGMETIYLQWNASHGSYAGSGLVGKSMLLLPTEILSGRRPTL